MTENSSVDKINKQGLVCIHPFTSMSLYFDGKAWNCLVPTFLKYSVGNIKQNSIAELWNNDTARWIRRKMYAGEWRDICNPTCHIIMENLRKGKIIKYAELENYKKIKGMELLSESMELLSPELIKEIRAKKDYLESPPVCFQLDNSSICNLHCIMCDLKQDIKREDPAMQKKLEKELEDYLPTAKVIFLTGRGEPFARPDTKNLLINYQGSAKFHLTTNGLLLPKYWQQIKHQNFSILNISVDAATKETYEKIRIGGTWKDLLKTLNLVKQNRDKFEAIIINMTVMRSNYKEIPQFIGLAESYGFTCLFQPVGYGKHGGENIFELKDTAAINEIKTIVIKENSKKRTICILWGSLLAQLNIPPTPNFRAF